MTEMYTIIIMIMYTHYKYTGHFYTKNRELSYPPTPTYGTILSSPHARHRCHIIIIPPAQPPQPLSR